MRPPVTHFSVTGFPSATAAGTASTFAIAAQDDLGRTFLGYRGTVHFTSSDPLTALPADYTFTAADNGRAIFGAALFTIGRQSITAADTSSQTLTGTEANAGLHLVHLELGHLIPGAIPRVLHGHAGLDLAAWRHPRGAPSWSSRGRST